MTDDREALANFPGAVRLFPLPNLVLFPHVVQGLHIFEMRYRELMVDTLESDMLFAMVLLKENWEPNYDGKPVIESVACLGRVTAFQKLPDGRYDLRLRGMTRVRLFEELESEKLYRTARAELLPDELPSELSQLTQMRHHLSGLLLERFPAGGHSHEQILGLLQSDLPLGQVCDVLSYALPFDLAFKQRMLNESIVMLRAQRLCDELRVILPVSTGQKFPPEFSSN